MLTYEEELIRIKNDNGIRIRNILLTDFIIEANNVLYLKFQFCIEYSSFGFDEKVDLNWNGSQIVLRINASNDSIFHLIDSLKEEPLTQGDVLALVIYQDKIEIFNSNYDENEDTWQYENSITISKYLIFADTSNDSTKALSYNPNKFHQCAILLSQLKEYQKVCYLERLIALNYYNSRLNFYVLENLASLKRLLEGSFISGPEFNLKEEWYDKETRETILISKKIIQLIDEIKVDLKLK